MRAASSIGGCAGTVNNTTTAMVLYSDNNESVEWINMCWRKVSMGLHCLLLQCLVPQADTVHCSLSCSLTLATVAGMAGVPEGAGRLDCRAAAARL